MTDIVERLRGIVRAGEQWATQQEAADELERLRTEVARQDRQIEALNEQISRLEDRIDKWNR